MTRPWVGAAIVALAAPATGCSQDWTIGGGATDASAGDTFVANAPPDGSVGDDGGGAGDAGASAPPATRCGGRCECTGNERCNFTCTDRSCTLTCSGSSDCELTCSQGATCNIECRDKAKCNLDCGGSSTCRLACRDDAACSAVCSARSTCAKDCEKDCDVKCVAGAVCR